MANDVSARSQGTASRAAARRRARFIMRLQPTVERSVLSWFERRIDPYPRHTRHEYSRRLLPFLWQCADGVRPYLLALTVLTGLIGAFEALLFSMLGRLIDWMGSSTPG